MQRRQGRGLESPPVGLSLSVTAGVAQTSVTKTVTAALPSVGNMFLILFPVSYAPIISTGLPTALTGWGVIVK